MVYPYYPHRSLEGFSRILIVTTRKSHRILVIPTVLSVLYTIPTEFFRVSHKVPRVYLILVGFLRDYQSNSPGYK